MKHSVVTRVPFVNRFLQLCKQACYSIHEINHSFLGNTHVRIYWKSHFVIRAVAKGNAEGTRAPLLAKKTPRGSVGEKPCREAKKFFPLGATTLHKSGTPHNFLATSLFVILSF